MAEGENSTHLPFRAIKLIETPDVEESCCSHRVDGELCRLDADWNPLEQHARPFPMSIQHAIVVGDVLMRRGLIVNCYSQEWDVCHSIDHLETA